jgi:hypothetical protein
VISAVRPFFAPGVARRKPKRQSGPAAIDSVAEDDGAPMVVQLATKRTGRGYESHRHNTNSNKATLSGGGFNKQLAARAATGMSGPDLRLDTTPTTTGQQDLRNGHSTSTALRKRQHQLHR